LSSRLEKQIAEEQMKTLGLTFAFTGLLWPVPELYFQKKEPILALHLLLTTHPVSAG